MQTEKSYPLNKIEMIFEAGRLCDKRDEMLQLMDEGETMVFSGNLCWSIFLAEYDKKIIGESESLDDAFWDMTACLSYLSLEHGEETEVLCSVTPTEPPRMEKTQ